MSERPSTSAVWRELHAELRGFLTKRVRDEHLVDDLVQESFARIHRHLGDLEDVGRMRAWVLQIARNVLADESRKARIPTTEIDDTVAAAVPERDERELVRSSRFTEELLAQLPATHREALRLAELEGLPQREVAERLGISLTATKSRIRRGRELARRELEACCRFEFDRRGGVACTTPKPDRRIGRDCNDC
jgi:RNA polymerase sigma-70 factor (ECF subfamily)